MGSGEKGGPPPFPLFRRVAGWNGHHDCSEARRMACPNESTRVGYSSGSRKCCQRATIQTAHAMMRLAKVAACFMAAPSVECSSCIGSSGMCTGVGRRRVGDAGASRRRRGRARKGLRSRPSGSAHFHALHGDRQRGVRVGAFLSAGLVGEEPREALIDGAPDAAGLLGGLFELWSPLSVLPRDHQTVRALAHSWAAFLVRAGLTALRPLRAGGCRGRVEWCR